MSQNLSLKTRIQLPFVHSHLLFPPKTFDLLPCNKCITFILFISYSITSYSFYASQISLHAFNPTMKSDSAKTSPFSSPNAGALLKTRVLAWYNNQCFQFSSCSFFTATVSLLFLQE